VLVELLLAARVFAFLEQVFGLVALAPRVGERERAILAVAVRAYSTLRDSQPLRAADEAGIDGYGRIAQQRNCVHGRGACHVC
jgi:hypothetical protein